MSLEKTATTPTRRHAAPQHQCSHESGSGLMQQAQGWADAARDALDSCERGTDAEAELRRRRNSSGQ